MDVKPALKKLEQSSNFREWHNKNKNTYFSYAFKIPQEMGLSDWQLGFYNRKNDKITTFVVTADKIEVRPEEEIFKKDDMEVNEVSIDKVKITFDNAIEKASEFQQKSFPKDRSIKTIVILQNMQKIGNVWNITYVTEAFNTLNMKIDASNGDVLEHNLSSIFSFRKQ
ncbi:hypothetical protein HYX08_05445 [Candidatus Woesearchaeota archaeon]|nr:hypothetical protein [Candidatus Woesearchaeota archaeon]